MAPPYFYRYVLATLLLFSVEAAKTADIALDIRVPDADPVSSDGGFLELGATLGLAHSPIRGDEDTGYLWIFLNGRYQWRNLFVEVIQDSFSSLSLGYNLWNDERWSLDFIGTQINQHLIDADNDNEELNDLNRRRADFLLGGRATAYYGNTILQYQLLGDVSDAHGGLMATAQGGRSWQIRNWNFHALAGLLYHSDRVTDHYLSVSKEEASTSLPQHDAKAGVLFLAEVGVTYPLSEHWVFRSELEYGGLSDTLRNSPIIDSGYGASLSTTFSYVF